MGNLKAPNKNLDAIYLDEGIIYYTKDESKINEIAINLIKSKKINTRENKTLFDYVNPYENESYKERIELPKLIVGTKNFFPKTIAEIITQHNSKGKYSITIYDLLPYSQSIQKTTEDVLLNFNGFQQ